MFQNSNLGQKGEDFASKFLKKAGFKIIERNFQTRWGELDIIAEKNDAIHFVEVKTRSSYLYGSPHEAVNYYKLQHLKRAAAYYLLKKGLTERKLSIDVVSITLKHDGAIDAINHFQIIE